jgi:Trypsin-like peptidase domain
MARRTAMRLLCLILLSANIVVAQSPQSRKDIPTIAKSAKGAIVTIVTANNDDPIALGSGFLVSSDGAIATNYHVIASGNVAVVKFADGTVLPVDGVLATDKVHDLAIIKIHGKTFQTLTLGNSDQIQVGEEVVAIGNPLGLELTVSNGILSGVRITKEEDKFLQTTAPISHGSSGGPLFNMLGEVVGVNALYLEGGASLNFAIPVNDVKNLLHNQFAQLQQLPNEPNTDKPETSSPKPDAPTALPSDAASPRENELGIDTPSHKTPSYYIRAYQRGAYIIEYNGRQLAATCRETLTWLDGMDKPGRLMGEHDCTYMPSLVGKQIRPELMWQHDKELRYQPWLGDDTVQTADILDITAEAPVGALLRRSSPKTSPEILKTLRWIQNTLDDDEGNTVYGMSNKDGALGTRVNLLPDVNGCQVTFAHATRGDEGKETYHQRLQVNLGDLDPTSLKVDTFAADDVIAVKSAPEVVPGDVISRTMSTVTVHTTDKVPSVRLTLNDRNWRTGTSLSSTDLSWELPAPYAARFSKALRQAITLCGGKSSSF